LVSLGSILLLGLGADRTAAGRSGSGRMPMRGLVALVAVAAVGLMAIGAGRATASPDAVAASEDSAVPALAWRPRRRRLRSTDAAAGQCRRRGPVDTHRLRRRDSAGHLDSQRRRDRRRLAVAEAPSADPRRPGPRGPGRGRAVGR